MRKKKRPAALLPVLLLAGALTACAGQGTGPGPAGEAVTAADALEDIIAEPEVYKTDGQKTARVQVFAMDTYMTLTAYGNEAEEAVLAGAEEVVRLDHLWSVGREDSEISILNREGEGQVSKETADLIELSLDVHEKSRGKLDITVYPLMELWGFTSGDYQVPDDARLAETLALVDAGQVVLNRNGDRNEEKDIVTLSPGQGLDLGAVAKGYTSGRVMEIFRDHGIESGLVSLGGNVQCLGTKTDGTLWRIGLQDPENAEEIFGVLEIADRAVITSGAYQRNFTDEATGKVYHHILDPDTGCPAETGILSATIISEDGALSDAMSTAAYCMGLSDAAACWQASGGAYEMVLVTEDGTVHVTEGLEEAFRTDRPLIIIPRD